MDGLKELVTQYANTSQAAEPMLALAQEYEIASNDDEAKKWYGKVTSSFAESDFAKKATGGKRRLDAVGNRWMISGPTLDGKSTLNPSALAGKVVIVQYWATWCDTCVDDFSALKKLQTKYGKGVQVVGVNLDMERSDALKAVKSANLPWPTLYEPGGFDSRFANEMGIFSLPLTILIDKQGKVVSRNITVDELDAELKKLVK
jgi:thiol-disulfide isomerase/thioredoxin